MGSSYRQRLKSSVALLASFLIGVSAVGTDARIDRAASFRAFDRADGSVVDTASNTATGDGIAEAYGRLPLSFERNVGQTNPQVEFLARGKGYTLFLNRGAEAVLSLRGGASTTQIDPAPHARPPDVIDSASSAAPSSGAVLKLRFVGANLRAPAEGGSELPGKVNYLTGRDRSKWRTGVPTYGQVRYSGIYPGIDVVYYGNQRQLEYDVVVKPGANPSSITLEFEGADRLAINDRGELIAMVGGRDVVQRPPIVYQDVDGERRRIDGRYVLVNRTRAAFHVDPYDTSRPLVIDPILVYSTYLDGTLNSSPSADIAYAIAVDGSGNAYITGSTDAGDYPTTAGAFDGTPNGSIDVFVSRLDTSGTSLAYATYLGGSGTEEGFGVAVDASGNAYVTGRTGSDDFPTTPGALDTSRNGSQDLFIAKLDAVGAALVYSTYVGGSSSDVGQSIAIDESGDAYVTGSTSSANFPTTLGAFDRIANGSIDAFVLRLNADGDGLRYSTYLGGTSFDNGLAIAVDGTGSAYVTGSTFLNFPTTAGAFDTSSNGSTDIFVTKLDASGATLTYSTLLGGSNDERGNGIALDAAGNVFVTGFTSSSNYPTTAGVFDPSFNGLQDAFVTKLDPIGATLTYSTYVGGVNNDYGYGIALDGSGNAYITGETLPGFPTTVGAFDTTWNGAFDAFVAKMNATGTGLEYSTFLGGAREDRGYGIAVDAAGNAYVAGYAISVDFPTTPGSFDPVGDNNYDSFVTKLGPNGTGLVYSTYVGGNYRLLAPAFGYGIAVDASGSAYVTGSISSADFPVTPGVIDSSSNGQSDVFVSKLDPSGGLSYSTYLGGINLETGYAIAVDSGGSAYVTGQTMSGDFPATAGAFDQTANGASDAFVAKLNATGTALDYATYIGGAEHESALGVSVDDAGSAYVAGFTNSVDWPTTAGAFDRTPNGSSDGFVAKLDASGTALSYSTYLGGSSTEEAYGIAVDSGGGAYVTGRTFSSDYPITGGAFDTSINGSADVFVTRLLADGAGLSFSTFVGGTDYEEGRAIALDTAGRPYVTGWTMSTDFQVSPGAFDVGANGGRDVFVTNLSANGATLVYSTYLGGSGWDEGYGIAVDSGGAAYVTGSAGSLNFPATIGALDPTFDGADVFVSKLDANGTALAYSTALGGSFTETGRAIAVDADNVYVVGQSASSNYPTTSGAFDSTWNGDTDVVITKILLALVETTTALGAEPNPSIEGEDVTLQATVSASLGSPSGTVEFFDEETSLGTAPLVGGIATLEVSTLGVGSHPLTAHYGGDGTFAASDSFSVTQVVNPSTFLLTVALAGAGTGTVTSDDGLISCPGDCEEVYASGSMPTLTATAGASSTFTGWSGGACTGTVPCMVTMDTDTAVTATFAVSGRDLVVSAVSNPPAVASPGSSYAVSDTTQNQGAALAGSSTTRFYLSPDAVKSTSDKLLTGVRVVPSLDSGVSSTGPTTVTIPATLAPGTYFQLACADDKKVVAETNEENNCTAASGTIAIVLPDLRETAVSAGPGLVAPGGKVTVTDTVENPSGVSAAASTTRYYLSPDAVKDAGDVLLTGTRPVASLLAGTSSTGSKQVTVPTSTPVGTYRVLACADDLKKVRETDETNNCLASAGTVQVEQPDLVTPSVSGPAAGTVGQKVTLTDTVVNQGSGPAGASSTRYYLSPDAVWSAGDVLLTGTRAVVALAPGGMSTGSKPVTVPAATPSGTYYMLACADDLKKVTETDEGNNCVASASTIVIGP